MAITIAGVRLDSVNISKDGDGKVKVSGNYSVLSSKDKVFAKQTFNGYDDIKVDFPAETQKFLDNFLVSAKRDIEGVLGLIE